MPYETPGDVPCNGCRRCCFSDAVRILPHEDASQWHTEPHAYLQNQLMLAHKPHDGACVYLGTSGCNIHERRPQQCREMDCRVIGMVIPRRRAHELHRQGLLKVGVWKTGRKLQKLYPVKLPAPERQ